jgi:hypothetical protein
MTEPTFPRGVTLTPATQEDIDRVVENFRDGDRRSVEVGGGKTDRVEDFERCWIVKAADGADLGYLGVMVMPDRSCMSRERGICFMSANGVDAHKIAFVAASKPVCRYAAKCCPPWVDTFLSWPLESYAASVRWQTRVLGFRFVRRVPAGSDAYIILETTRKEMQ